MNLHLLDSLNRESPTDTGTTALPISAFNMNRDDQGIIWLTFDTPDSAANVWNETTLGEFNRYLEIIERDSDVRALVILSAKEKIFIAGADLKALRHLPARRLERLIELGQSTFNRLAALPIPKVALIHGACVGGGLEMALACDARIASDNQVTRLGLPETQLGLIPAWGGSTRLPRLLGLPTALNLIVSGRQLKATAALKLGLVDRVVPREHLASTARHMIAHGLPCHRLPLLRALPSLPGLRGLLAQHIRRNVRKHTRGLYPAPLRAIEVATQAARAPLDQAMEAERRAIIDLALTPETERLIDLFLRQEQFSKKPHPHGVALPITDIAVIGAGVMGAGIAHWAASRGVRVLLQDTGVEPLARGLQRIHQTLDEGLRRRALSRRDKRDILDRISLESLPVSLNRFPLILEAATESMELKKTILTSLASRTSADAILATNTSALSVTELASVIPHPERVIGLHFFNPVHRMPLVEIITTASTTDDVIATAVAFAQKLGKTPILVKDSPGFVVNRILMPYLMEAVRLYDSGVPAEVIDEAMLEFGMPMGPLRLLDEIGLDVALHVGRTLTAAFPDRLTLSPTLEHLIAAGRLGRKAGGGFYSSKSAKSPRRVTETDPAFQESLQQRLALLLSNEAAHCAAEGLVRDPAEIDLAMILGTGYPAFRGGPLAWLRQFGVDHAIRELEHHAETTPAPNAFRPAPLLSKPQS